MPLNSSQLAALVDRARQKPPPVVSVSQPPAQRDRSHLYAPHRCS